MCPSGDPSCGLAKESTRVLAAGQNDSLDFLEMMKSLAESYAPAYKALAEGKPVTCAATGTVFDSVIPPSAVILDVSGTAFHSTKPELV